MTAIELITPPLASTRAPNSTVGEEFDEALPLFGAVWVAGPPIILVAGPLVLLALMLAGPFVLIVTLVVVLVAAAALVGLSVAAPYLLVRHFRGHRADPTSTHAPAVNFAWASRWDAT